MWGGGGGGRGKDCKEDFIGVIRIDVGSVLLILFIRENKSKRFSKMSIYSEGREGRGGEDLGFVGEAVRFSCYFYVWVSYFN